MFITDQLIYIQMQKTGCTHIAWLLSELFDGEQVGKHNAASANQIHPNTYFVSSIRNPWDWYLSLWTFGVQGRGALMNRLIKRNSTRVLKTFLRNPMQGCSTLLHAVKKDVPLWRKVYDDDTNVGSFRKWLQLIHAPENARWLDDGYENSSITDFCGLMTYRYLNLCCSERWKLNSPNLISSFDDLIQFEKQSCYIDFFIRQESLEDDFIKAVEKLRPLTEDEKRLVLMAKKTNSSQRPLSITDYYDDGSIDLIGNREKLLIEKFNYSPPLIAGPDAVPDNDSATHH